MNNIEQEIGAQIRSVRAKKRITQRQIAMQLGISTHQLYKYESGRDKVSVSRLHEIAIALEVLVVELLPTYF